MEDFSDDGFDELNVALLQELENNALESLQSQRSLQQHAGPSSLYRSQRLPGGVGVGVDVIQIEDDVDQADAETLRKLAHVPVQHSLSSRLAVAAAPPPLPLPAYSQHSIANMPLPAASSIHPTRIGVGLYPGRRPQGRPAAPAVVPMPQMPQMPQMTTTVTRQLSVVVGSGAPECLTIPALQARVRMLETDLYTASGKASMIQKKYDEAQRQFEADIARVQRQRDEELAEQYRRAEAAVAAHEAAATELEFTKQDLKEEVEKSKKGRRGDRVDGIPTTPRKGTSGRSNWGVADGFEDIELLPSPSKGAGRRSKDAAGGGAVIPALERTPTKTKRRRPTTDSPTKPLQLLAVDTDVVSPSADKADKAAGRPGCDSSARGRPPAPQPEVAPLLVCPAQSAAEAACC